MPDHEGVTAPPIDLPGNGTDPGALPGWGAALAAKLDLQIGKITDAQAATTREIRALRNDARNAPASVTRVTQFTYSTAAGAGITQDQGSGIGVLLGGPELGQQWSVRATSVLGSSLTATPAGVAWYFIAPAIAADLSAINVIDWTKAALPQNAFYGEREFFVPPNSNVFVVITGGTNATLYTVNLSFLQSAYLPAGTEIAI